MVTLKELAEKPERLSPGHRTCTGCGIPQIVRTVLSATDKPVVASCATGCLEVTTTVYPYTSWKIPWMHSAFENAAATIAGIESAYNALKRRGKINKDIKFVAFGGDGGTYDIGLQALSGAMERGHDFVYVCYDNEAYMNTGVQRSGATPYGADTTTSPEGIAHHGKEQFKKNFAEICVAHGIPYVAQSAMHAWQDLYNKAEKAFKIKGPCVLVVLQPCTLGWGFDSSMAVEMSRLATETNLWPLYEVECGRYTLNYQPSQKLPITEFIKHQKRFRHLMKPENKSILDVLQKNVDDRFQNLAEKCRLRLSDRSCRINLE
jgi:pyruvate ferredoxin oxidoreductase beta subunit